MAKIKTRAVSEATYDSRLSTTVVTQSTTNQAIQRPRTNLGLVQAKGHNRQERVRVTPIKPASANGTNAKATRFTHATAFNGHDKIFESWIRVTHRRTNGQRRSEEHT